MPASTPGAYLEGADPAPPPIPNAANIRLQFLRASSPDPHRGFNPWTPLRISLAYTSHLSNLKSWMYSVSQNKIPPYGFVNFFPNGWEFLINFYAPIIRSFLHYTLSQKNKQSCFCHNFLKFSPILIIFGTKMANSVKLYEEHSFSTSPNSR